MKSEITKQKRRIYLWEQLEKSCYNPAVLVEKECTKSVPGIGVGVAVADSLIGSLWTDRL